MRPIVLLFKYRVACSFFFFVFFFSLSIYIIYSYKHGSFFSYFLNFIFSYGFAIMKFHDPIGFSCQFYIIQCLFHFSLFHISKFISLNVQHLIMWVSWCILCCVRNVDLLQLLLFFTIFFVFFFLFFSFLNLLFFACV